MSLLPRPHAGVPINHTNHLSSSPAYWRFFFNFTILSLYPILLCLDSYAE